MRRLLSSLLLATLLVGGRDVAALHQRLDTARQLIRDGKLVAALHELSLIEKQHPGDPEAKLAVGEIFQELAAARAEQLQRVAPDSAPAHELLGKSYEARGQLDDALKQYLRAQDINTRLPGIHFLLGNLNWKLKDTAAAIAQLKQELELNPHHAMANLRLGQILLDTDRDHPGNAIAYLREATADAGSSIEAHRELGKALRLDRQFPQAVQQLQLVALQRPNDESVHAQLAALYRDMGDTQQARREIEIHAQILRRRLQASQAIHAHTAP